ncbi:sugar phosphate isomerase/epimerase [Paenibacillus sp.]|uniref:sugar phosphate isomerase/epimerase family protein n=1 Tax=Paenibacillus sp. TaxID=58172 RepID=UPI002811585B|nr:sugar phosphate isomerase/epimerase [Paenibacillus sp.]
MSVGVLAHLFGSLPAKQLAAEVSEAGFSHVQLALWKAISDVDFSEPGKLSPGLASYIGEEFAKRNVSISVLGCYLHLFDRDVERRRANHARFKELLRYARSFGCSIVAAESGTLPGSDYNEQDWKAMRHALEELAEEAERWGVFVGMEPANGHLIGTASELGRLLEEVPSPNVGVVIDPGNLLTEGNFATQDDVIREAFDLLGDRIIAAHAKDRFLSEDGKLLTASPGYGRMNYDLYLKLLHRYKPYVHIVMEQATRDVMAYSKQYIERIRAGYEGQVTN